MRRRRPLQGTQNRIGHACRPHGLRLHPPHADGGFGQQFAIKASASGLLDKHDTGFAHMLQPGGNGELIIQPRRPVVFDGSVADHEHAAGLVFQGLLVHAKAAQPFSARTLKKLQVVGVVDDPPGIGVLPIHAHRMTEGRMHGGAHGQMRRERKA